MPWGCSGELTCPWGVAGVCQEHVSPGFWNLPPGLTPMAIPVAPAARLQRGSQAPTASPYTVFLPPRARSRPGFRLQPHQGSAVSTPRSLGEGKPWPKLLSASPKTPSSQEQQAALLRGGSCILVPERSHTQQ